MSCCARCGQGICSTAGKIALNKAWHKNCFCCYNCNRPLDINCAKIYYGEVFCHCCCPQPSEPLKLCKVNSTPSCTKECIPPKMMRSACCDSDTSQDGCRPRDVRSCGCIPSCYRERSPPCSCCCPPPTPPPKRCKPPAPCRKKMMYYRSCSPCGRPPCSSCCCRNNNSSNSNSCRTERCRRCGEKVFAAEKILTAYGCYHLGCFSCCCCCKSLCVKTMYEACGEIYCRQCYNSYFGVSGYRYRC